MSNTYLGILWQCNKKIFLIACLFIAGAFLPLWINFEITPFYAWRMYAWPMMAHKEYDTYILRYNGKEYNNPHTAQDYNRMMIMYTMPHYDAIRQTGDTIPFYTKTSYLALAAFKWNPRDNRLHMTTEDLDHYAGWLSRYTAQQTGEPIQSITVDRVSLAYGPDQRVKMVNTVNIINR
jgi:hypothetical protein